jgi:hypothetical protein
MPLAPNTLPARAFQQSTRTSRLLFHWRASDLSLTPLTGQVPTFVRATGGGLVRDSQGFLRDVGQYQPRFEYYDYDSASGLWLTPGLLIEGARTNLVVQSDALTAANGWTLDGALVVTPNYSTCGALPLSRVTGAAVDNLHRAVTLTGDGVKAFSQVVQFDGVAGTTKCGLFDLTAGVFRGRVTVTWAADGTATAVATEGTLLAFVALAVIDGKPTYRILGQASACTAVNTHRTYPHQAGTATSIRIGGVDVENAAYPSSVIRTTTGMVQRNADVLAYTVAFNTDLEAGETDDFTAYAKFLRPVWATGTGIGSIDNPNLFAVGSASLAAAGSLEVYAGGGGVSLNAELRTGTIQASGSRTVPTTSSIEVLGQYENLATGGVCRLDVGAGFGADSAAAAAATALLGGYLNLGDGSNTEAYAAFTCLKVARGLFTLAQMREAY